MIALFGFGNPGKEYEGTRHNVGYMVIDLLEKKYSIPLNKKAKTYIYGVKDNLYLVKPITYVNSVDKAVQELMDNLNIQLKDIFLILDDVSLALGRTRLRLKGSSGGHKGLKAIIYTFKTQEFPRLRIGIGPSSGDLAEFVLQKFSEHELKILERVFDRVLQSIDLFLEGKIEEAIRLCNKRKLDDLEDVLIE